ncbi:hypothetical protein STSP2_02113 [Anaerohalosphaera lusitana]|uniref:LamG-like jellyroll fold domain-containing protein n=1 Tax=Anaerohalosphaera lusitana TaxID=1936003 RepID=A0A1U9NN45_9BACT|nr:LamG-like jellyroll fold domain-containing protein [Anaerohalosphaera lusitana]AQT68936.1 hypothetical protein STSP2_02113 [Anaerohalosphaera lusitana]
MIPLIRAALIFVCTTSFACLAQTTARWSMQWSHISNPVVRDSAFGLGEGPLGGAGGPIVEFDHLWYFGNAGFTASHEQPPQSLFSSGFFPHGTSYNAGAQFGDGILFFPQDQYGNEFDYHDSFTVEGFFKTHGNQSAAGIQQILLQGENDYSYGITINEGGPGWLCFGVNVTGDGIVTVKANAKNYADGSWHYFAARYDDPADTIELMTASTDGRTENKSVQLSSGTELITGGAGNMLIGRETFQGARQFAGLIDEIRLTNGYWANAHLMGRITAKYSPQPAPRQTGVTLMPQLQWDDGEDVFAYNVYFGQTDPPAYRSHQSGTTYYIPAELEPGTTYLWRVDRLLQNGTTIRGELWSFTTHYTECDGPMPHDYNGDCTINMQDLSHFAAAWLDCGLVPETSCWY